MASSFPSAALRKAVRVLARTMLALLLFTGFGSPALAAAWTSEQLTVPATPDGTLVNQTALFIIRHKKAVYLNLIKQSALG